eukprot:TRINITY_DN13060_c0_g2_i1.p1 TRINITY_DN13060_c0_g2~~TRINITY_DN13060_c0_g2_i1.p1  ORF type:complete len:672 (+),score=23.94 TRINITY_DN13060_c0_g2_i1:67-2016(+)
MGVKVPTAIQNSAIPAIMDNNRVIVAAPTGTGKTLAYMLPVIARLQLERQNELPEMLTERAPSALQQDDPSEPKLAVAKEDPEPVGPDATAPWWDNTYKRVRTFDTGLSKPSVVIMAPSRELVWQLGKVAKHLCRKTGIVVAPIAGRMEVKKQRKVFGTDMDILITTPETLAVVTELGTLSLEDCKYVVMDEADTLLEYRFYQTILPQLGVIERLPKEKETAPAMVLVVATYTSVITDWIYKRYGADHGFRLARAATLHTAPSGVRQLFLDCGFGEKIQQLLDVLRGSGHSPQGDFVNELAMAVPDENTKGQKPAANTEEVEDMPTGEERDELGWFDDKQSNGEGDLFFDEGDDTKSDMVEDDFDWGDDFSDSPGDSSMDKGATDSYAQFDDPTSSSPESPESKPTEEDFDKADTTDWAKIQWKVEKRAGMAPVNQGRKDKVVIFCNSTSGVTVVSRTLMEKGLHCHAYSKTLDRNEKRVNLVRWQREEGGILVCTDALSRGMDFADVDHVVNFDFPMEAVTYLHRVGRIGRMGRKGKATSLVTRDFKTIASRIQAHIKGKLTLEEVSNKVEPHKPAKKGRREIQKELADLYRKRRLKHRDVVSRYFQKKKAASMKYGHTNWEMARSRHVEVRSPRDFAEFKGMRFPAY